ncbi:MAG: tripartite tricarboxylate transporter TctB family protein [Planctomycetota bacterium]|jgi:hypothetical protein|nr:tripartite tricarboxylate transporter TctB family protein [Planctomycetota bacterium]
MKSTITSGKLLRAIFSAVVLAMGVFLLAYAYRVDQGAIGGSNFSPMFYPKIILWCWVTLTSVMLAQSAYFLKDQPEIALNWFPLLAGVILIGLVCGLLQSIGFVPVCLGFMLFYPACLGYRRKLVLVVVGVLFTIGCWYVFNNILGISLPELEFVENFLYSIP